MAKTAKQYSPELIEAAAKLNMSVEELAGGFFNPPFIAGMGYKLKVTKAKNSYTKGKGAHQVALTNVPLTGDNKEVRQGTFTIWLTYPFDVKATGFKFATPQDREKARRTMAQFLKIANPGLVTYRTEQVGTTKFYTDVATGEKIDDASVKTFFEKDRILVATAMREAESDPKVFEGLTYHAIYSPWVTREGDVKPDWSWISAEPLDGKTYATDRSAMFDKGDGGSTPAAETPSDDVAAQV